MVITLKESYRRRNYGELLIVDPPWNINNDKINGTRASSRWPHEYKANRMQSCIPFFMAHACSYLRQNGVNAHMTVFSPPRIPYLKFLNEIVKRQYKVIIVETSSPTITSDMNFCRDLKKTLNCKIVLVGGYATANAEECIRYPFVDAVLKGEYEINALRYYQTMEPGIYDYQIVKDINMLPPAYREDIIFGKILSNNGTFRATFKQQFQMWGSRGCPFRCSFCMYPPVMYNRYPYRPRSAESIAYELDRFIRMNGHNRFHVWFDDDTFNIGNKRMIEIADVFKKRDIQYAAMCRADTIKDFSVLKHMADCGFMGCAIGVESGCQELVDGCNKDLNLDDVVRFREWCNTLKIAIHMTFTFGLKGETHATIEQTKRFIEKVRPDSYQTSGCSPVKGTEYHDFLNNAGLINESSKLDGTTIFTFEGQHGNI